MAQLSLKDAVQMATRNPARMAGIASGLIVGQPADLGVHDVALGIGEDFAHEGNAECCDCQNADGSNQHGHGFFVSFGNRMMCSHFGKRGSGAMRYDVDQTRDVNGN